MLLLIDIFWELEAQTLQQRSGSMGKAGQQISRPTVLIIGFAVNSGVMACGKRLILSHEQWCALHRKMVSVHTDAGDDILTLITINHCNDAAMI